MELTIRDGDYVPDGSGALARCEGTDEVLQRVLWKLSIRRGCFPFLPQLGSRLCLLSREKPSARLAAARQYVAEALSDEGELEVEDVKLKDLGDGRMAVAVELGYRGERLEVTV